MGTDGPSTEVVADELKRIAERVYSRVFGAPESAGRKPLEPISVPNVATIAKQHWPDQWQEGPTEAIGLTLRRAAEQLKGNFGNWQGVQISAHEVAVRYFNLGHKGSASCPPIAPVVLHDPAFEKVGGDLYNKVVASLRAAISGKGIIVSKQTINRKLGQLRSDLANILISLDRSRAVPAGADVGKKSEMSAPVRQAPVDEYVARPEYEHIIRGCRSTDDRRIWLYGEAGTGKTRLAQAANSDIINEASVPVLSADDPVHLERQVAALIVRNGIAAESVNPTNVWPLFLQLAQEAGLPPVVVFDDMRDVKVLDLLEVEISVMLIFTSVHRPPARYCGPSLEVQEMSPPQSEEMIKSWLPNISREDLAALFDALHGRPLAIEQSCTYLRDTRMSIPAFCLAIKQGPARTLENIGHHDRTLTRVYELILETLSAAPGILQVLDAILFTHRIIAEDMLSHLTMRSADVRDNADQTILEIGALPGVVYIDDKTTIPHVGDSPVSLYAAIRRLKDFSLVRSDTQGAIVMHQLTRVILRQLRENFAEIVCDQIVDTIDEMTEASGWGGGDALPMHVIIWSWHLHSVFDLIDNTDSYLSLMTAKRLSRLVRACAVMLRAFRQCNLPIHELLGSMDNIWKTVTAREVYLSESLPDVELRRNMSQFIVERTELAILSTSGGAISTGVEHNPLLRRLLSGIVLSHDTEWELATHFVDVGRWEHKAHQGHVGAKVLRLSGSCYKELARDAVRISSIFYTQARWKDAIAALEHAYSCYIKVGGNVECIRGAIDAARRLARVNTRAGSLNDAALWLARAHWVIDTRSHAVVADLKPFYLNDQILELQMLLTFNELELTQKIFEWDTYDFELSAGDRCEFVGRARPELDQGYARCRYDEACDMVVNSPFAFPGRYIAELLMYKWRLEEIDYSVDWNRDDTRALEQAYRSEGLVYQHSLLRLQQLTAEAPTVASIFRVEGVGASHTDDDRANAVKIADAIYQLSSSMASSFSNPYWHARGLCAAHILGMAAGSTRPWLRKLRSELHMAAEAINRLDWIDKVEQYPYESNGLWLVGY